MTELDAGFKLLISLAIGAAIGLERQVGHLKLDEEKGGFSGDIGLRTFSLTALLGTLLGFLVKDFSLVFGILTAAFFILMLSHYIMGAIDTKDIGITTEISLVFTFLIGVLISLNIIPIQILLASSVIVLMLLSQKQRLHEFINKINKQEIQSFISFAIIAVVILPFLPNTTYAFSDINGGEGFLKSIGLNLERVADIEFVNPFKLWMIVALITGVDILGYILERTIGSKKGWVITSLAAGFISSTAATQSLAAQSKKTNVENHLVGAALMSNMASFFQIAILIASINSFFFVKALPFIIILVISSLSAGLFFLLKKEKGSEANVISEKSHTIFNIYPALKFALLFLIINIFSKLALEFFGSNGFLIATALGSIPGIDAVTINTSELAGNKIDFALAIWGLVIANAVNLISKTSYSFLQGSKAFAIKFGISVAVIILASLISPLFI